MLHPVAADDFRGSLHNYTTECNVHGVKLGTTVPDDAHLTVQRRPGKRSLHLYVTPVDAVAINDQVSFLRTTLGPRDSGK